MKTYPVLSSQLSATGAAVVVMPWIMAGINALANNWGVPLPDAYEAQVTAGVSGLFALAAAWWATNRVIAPTLTLPKVPDAE